MREHSGVITHCRQSSLVQQHLRNERDYGDCLSTMRDGTPTCEETGERVEIWRAIRIGDHRINSACSYQIASAF